MSVTTTIEITASARRTTRSRWRGGLLGKDCIRALAFITPYVAVFLAFVLYPVAYGIWLGSDPST